MNYYLKRNARYTCECGTLARINEHCKKYLYFFLVKLYMLVSIFIFIFLYLIITI